MTALYILTAVRMLVPLEFSFTKGIEFPLYNPIRETLIMHILNGSFSVSDLLGLIWGAGTVFSLMEYLHTYRKAVCIIQTYTLMDEPELFEILDAVNKKYHGNIRVTYRCSKNISVPMGFGIFYKTILLPERTYDTEELYYIIAHECNHFYNHDLLVKMAIKIFCCIFWWNPIAYLLYSDVESTLEIKCDYTVCRKLSRSEIDEYIQTIIREVKRMLGCGKDRKNQCVEAVCFLKNDRRNMIKERIEALSDRSSKISGFMVAGIVGCFTVITMLSYIFVCQPYYPAPNYAENGEPYYSGEQLEIYREENGEYWVRIEGTDDVFKVAEADIEWMIEDGAHFLEE